MFGKIFKNTFWLSASQIIASVIGFFYFIFLARKLGVQNFGYYVFTLSFVYNFIPVADFGIEKLVLRDLSRESAKEAEYFSKLVPLRIVLALVSYALIIILSLIIGLPQNQLIYLLIFGLGLLPYSLIFLFANFQNAKEKMEYMSLANILTTLITALLGSLFALSKLNIFWIFTAYPLANCLILMFFIVLSKKQKYSLKFNIDINFWKKIFRECWYFAFLTILAVFYLRLSVLMINFLLGPTATGYYSTAFKLVESLILLPQSLTLALFPISSRLINQDKNKLKTIYLKGLGVLFLASIPVFLIFLLFPNLIVNFAFGSKYLPAVSVFGILGFALILFFLNSLPGNIIQNSNKLKKFLPFALLNLLITLLLCFLLIPRFNIVGAAWAVVGGEVFGLIINNYFVYKILRNES